MANKKFWLGMLVMVLVFGMSVVGCSDGNGNGDGDIVTFINYSDYIVTINVRSDMWDDSPIIFTLVLPVGATRTHPIPSGFWNVTHEPMDLVHVESDWAYPPTYTFTNRY